MNYSVKGNTIFTAKNSVFFKTNVRKVIELGMGDRIAVLLDAPENSMTNNLLCLDSELNVLRRSEPLEKKYPKSIIYPFDEMVSIEGRLYVFDIVCRRFQIDPSNGEIIGYTVMR